MNFFLFKTSKFSSWMNPVTGLFLAGVVLLGCGQSDVSTPSSGLSQPELAPTPQLAIPELSMERPFSLKEFNSLDKSPQDILKELSPVDQAHTVINSLAFSLLAFRCHTGRFPSGEEGFQILIDRPMDGEIGEKWQGPYTASEFLTDPWGNAYIYQWIDGPELLYELRSYGPDGQPETGDDLTLSDITKSAQFARRSYIDSFAQMLDQYELLYSKIDEPSKEIESQE